MVLDDLISRLLVFLSGKGGVGQSVVGLALALAARERRKKVLLVETDSPLEASRYLGKPPSGPKETERRRWRPAAMRSGWPNPACRTATRMR